MTDPATLKPPRVEVICPFGHRMRTRNAPGSQMPCTRCHQDAGRTVLVTVPQGPGNAPTIRPAVEPPAPSPAHLAAVTRRRTGPATVACSGCHASVDLSVPPRPGEPAGWLLVGAGNPDGPDDRKSELLARCCSAECLAVVLPAIRERLAELPYQPADRPSSARTVSALMREMPYRRQ